MSNNNQLHTEVFEIVASLLNKEVSDMRLSMETNLLELGINSVDYIRIVVALESKLNIEFDDEDLNYERFNTIDDIIYYVQERYGTDD